MTSINRHIALIVSTERLWPYDSSAGGDTKLAFGMNLATSMVAGTSAAGPVADGDMQVLKPWNWNLFSGNSITFWISNVIKNESVQVGGQIIPLSNPLQGDPLTALKNTMEAQVKNLSDQAYYWDPLNPKGDETSSAMLYRHLLGSTSTMPAPVPYALDLAVCFTLSINDLKKAVAAKAFDINDFITTANAFVSSVVVLASPTYGIGAATAAPSSSDPQSFPPGSNVWQWPYNLAGSFPGGNTPVYAYTAQVDLTEPKADKSKSLLDLSSYWILNSGNTFGDDWSTKLADAVANAWDLPRLLLNAAPGLAENSKLLNPQAYWDAVIAALHDRANSGWINAPDGAGLLRFAVLRAAPKSSANPSTEVVEGWIRSLRSQLRAYEQANLSLDAWLLAVGAAVLATTGLPSTGGKVEDIKADLAKKTLIFTVDSTAGLHTADWVFVAGSNEPNANGRWRIESLSGTTFTVSFDKTLTGGSAGPACTLWSRFFVVPSPSGGKVTGVSSDGKELTFTVDLTWSMAFRPMNGSWSQTRPTRKANGSWQIGSLTSTSFSTDSKVSPTGVGNSCTWTGLDFTPLEQAYNSLADNDVLAKLLYSLWDTAFSQATLPLAAGKSREEFVETAPAASFTTFSDGGMLDLSDGSTWYITVGSLKFNTASWDGQTFSIWLSDYSATQSLRLAVTQAHDSGQPVLKFHMSSTTAAASLPSDVTSPPLQGTSDPYHVRIIICRDTTDSGATGGTSAFNVYYQVSDTDPPIAAGMWKFAAPPAMPMAPGMPMSQVSVKLSNDSAASGPTLSFEPPSAISVRGSNAGTVVAAWDADRSMNHALSAWQALGSKIHDDFNSGANGLLSRRTLALANISRVWPLLHGAMMLESDEIEALKKAFIEQLGAYFSARFNLKSEMPTSAYRDYLPMPNANFDPVGDKDLIAAIEMSIDNGAQALKATLVPPAIGSASSDGQSSANQQALVIPIDRHTAFDDPDPVAGSLDNDPVRKIAGGGLLMQQPDNTGQFKANGIWYAVNTATLSCKYDKSGKENYTQIRDLVPVPLRVTYRDGVKYPFVSYDNNPVNARSILAQFAVLRKVVANDGGGPDSPFHFDAPILDSSKSPWAKILALKYGNPIRILAYCFGSSGALPQALSSGHPAELTSDPTLGGLAGDPNSKFFKKYVREVTYLRQVGIGLPRLRKGSDPLSRVYPVGTAPLARELELTVITKNYPTARFFYNTGSRTGQLPVGESWSVIIPRLADP